MLDLDLGKYSGAYSDMNLHRGLFGRYREHIFDHGKEQSIKLGCGFH